MNHWFGIGRICNEIEARTTQDGKPIAKYRLAVNRAYKRDGQDEADFLNCVAFGKNAEFAQNYLTKGMKIAVEGSIRTGSYEKDGVRHYTTDIMVDRMEFCESKNSRGDADDSAFVKRDAGTGFEVVTDDPLPF